MMSSSAIARSAVVQLGMLLVDREVVLTVVGVTNHCTDPSPSGPSRSTVGGITPDPERLAQQVGGDLAPVEAGLEVPQRTLAAHRLVDRRVRPAVVLDVDEERRVAAVRHPALDVDLAAQQVLDRIVDIVDPQFDAARLGFVVVLVCIVLEIIVEFVVVR